MQTVRSRSGATIRLPDERWVHITEEHSELAGYLHAVLETVFEPSSIYEGGEGELIAVREIEAGKFLAVIYKESGPADGFVITAFFTRRLRRLERRKRLWPT